MNIKFPPVVLAALLPAAFLLATPPARAGLNDILIGIDEKVVIGPEGTRMLAPGKDAVLVMDVSDPARPKIRASLALMNSLVGPPTNLQITPDGKLALVANSVLHRQDGDKWVSAPDDKLYVIDLTASPPKLVETVTVGRQPSGLAITHQGDRALIANRAGKSITVLTIKGTEVRVAGELAMEDEIACVAITPDGKRVFACKNAVNKVAVLSFDGTKLTTDKTMDIATAFNPYNIDITPDGKYAVVANNGLGNGNTDTLSVIEAGVAHPHVIDHVTVGVGPEGLTISPNGRWAATPLLQGSSLKASAWNYTRAGAAVLLSIGAGGKLQPVNTLPAGGLPEGIAFDPRSTHIYVGNYSDRNIQVYRIAGGKLTDTGFKLQLPGQPASMRGPAR